MAAKAPSQGDYSIGGLQSICIVADGTWYGETFPAWGGRWLLVGKTLLIHLEHGHPPAGADDDRVAVERLGQRRPLTLQWARTRGVARIHVGAAGAEHRVRYRV